MRDLSEFLRECYALVEDYGYDTGGEYNGRVVELRQRFEELLKGGDTNVGGGGGQYIASYACYLCPRVVPNLTYGLSMPRAMSLHMILPAAMLTLAPLPVDATYAYLSRRPRP